MEKGRRNKRGAWLLTLHFYIQSTLLSLLLINSLLHTHARIFRHVRCGFKMPFFYWMETEQDKVRCLIQKQAILKRDETSDPEADLSWREGTKKSKWHCKPCDRDASHKLGTEMLLGLPLPLLCDLHCSHRTYWCHPGLSELSSLCQVQMSKYFVVTVE